MLQGWARSEISFVSLQTKEHLQPPDGAGFGGVEAAKIPKYLMTVVGHVEMIGPMHCRIFQ